MSEPTQAEVPQPPGWLTAEILDEMHRCCVKNIRQHPERSAHWIEADPQQLILMVMELWHHRGKDQRTEAAAAERALPISMEYVCHLSPTGDRFFGYGYEAVFWGGLNPKASIWKVDEDDDPGCGTFIRDCYTRGQLMDLMTGLSLHKPQVA